MDTYVNESRAANRGWRTPLSMVCISVGVVIAIILTFYPEKVARSQYRETNYLPLQRYRAGFPLSKEFSPKYQVSQDLTIQKNHVGDFQIGSTGTYFVTVTNVGTGTITGEVSVTDILPNGLVPIQSSGTGWTPCGFSGQTVVCIHPNAGGVAPGSSLPTINITVDVTQAAAPSVTNAATVTNANDTNGSNNTASDPTTIISADLAVTKSATPAVPSELNPVTFTLSLRNNGPSDTTGVVLTDTLPTGLTFLSSSTTRGSYNSNTGLWTVGNLANAEQVTLTITALVNSNTRGQTIVNTTNGVRSNLYDYQAGNNQGSASIRVASTRLIGLVSELGTTTPVISATVVFTDSLNRVYNTTTTASGWYTFTETASIPISPGSFSVRASRTGYRSTTIFSTLSANIDNRQDIPLATSDLAAGKRANVTTVVPGQILTYTLAITNVGSIQAEQIVITDVLPSHLTYITDTLGIPHTTPSTGTIVWRPSASLATNSSINFRMRVRVASALPNPTTSIVNTMTTRTGSPEANTSNNTASVTVTSTGTPNVGITKSVFPTQVRTGQNATYTIVVNNTGTAPVTDAEVVDQFSSLVDIVSVTTTKGTATTNSTTRRVTVDIGTLNVNEVVTITVIVRVNSSATTNTSVSNTASVSYLFGGTTSTRTSNNVIFQLLASSTLPPTGGVELTNQASENDVNTSLPALLSGILLGLLGLFAIGYGLWAQNQGRSWGSWAFKMGVMFVVVAFVFGFVGWGLANLMNSNQLNAQSDQAVSIESDSDEIVGLFSDEQPDVMPPSELASDAVLPDYPIPTPTVMSSDTQPDKPVDTSPVKRLVLPSLGVDTVVKYVPFDGMSWQIAGLKQEVAWMGDTSWPGLGGNTALAGHVTLRSGENGPFRYLDELRPEDLVRVYTEHNVYTYKVREKRIVDETDLSVVQPTEDTLLTLITCTGWDERISYYVKRLVIVADLENIVPIKTRNIGN